MLCCVFLLFTLPIRDIVFPAGFFLFFWLFGRRSHFYSSSMDSFFHSFFSFFLFFLVWSCSISLPPRHKVGWTSLVFAASSGHTDVVRLLLERGADVNFATSVSAAIPYFRRWPAETIRYPTMYPVMNARVEHVSCFVRQDGSTALTRTAAFGHTDVARLLLNDGADVNHVDKVSAASGVGRMLGGSHTVGHGVRYDLGRTECFLPVFL